MKKKTLHQFKEELQQINDKIEIIGEYNGTNSKIHCRCLVCATEWDPIPKTLLKGIGCPECGKKKAIKSRTKTLDQFKSELKNINDNIECISSDYVNTEYKLQFKCKVCNNIWKATPHSILSGRGCPKCAIKKRTQKRTKSHEQFLEEMLTINSDIEILSKYINNKTKVKYKCKKCGQIHECIAQHLLRGVGCPNCYNESKKTTIKDFINRANKIHSSKYDYSKVKFNVLKDKVVIVCPKHGEFEQEAGAHLQGRGCPKCQRTYGEQLIANWLDLHCIDYVEQYPLQINDILLKLDFYIPKYNIIIEYNGEQHYKYVPYFHKGGMTDYDKQVSRDNLLKEYCINNKILLLQIKYNLKNEEIKDLLNETFHISNP